MVIGAYKRSKVWIDEILQLPSRILHGTWQKHGFGKQHELMIPAGMPFVGKDSMFMLLHGFGAY
jgi:hypothetical protein